MIDGNIIEFQLGSEFSSAGGKFLNVFHYEWQSNEPAPALVAVGQGVVDAYFLVVTEAISNMCSVEVTFKHVKIINLSNPDEFWEGDATTPLTGAITGECCPPFVSWGFQLNRVNRTTRNGYKRFPGVAESSQSNGAATAGSISLANGVAGVIGEAQTLTVASPGTLEFTLVPKIVRKDTTGALVLTNGVTSASFKGIGSQNTRKYGRGV